MPESLVFVCQNDPNKCLCYVYNWHTMAGQVSYLVHVVQENNDASPQINIEHKGQIKSGSKKNVWDLCKMVKNFVILK